MQVDRISSHQSMIVERSKRAAVKRSQCCNLFVVCDVISVAFHLTMAKNTKKNVQLKDDLEENLSDDLQAETDQGVMKYMFLYITGVT